jgi:uncharacterized RmlC-like cupin family protein
MGSPEAAGTVGLQGQRLLPCITREACGAAGISAGMVYMPPRTRSKAHYHANSEIIVVCVRGRAATLIGPESKPYFHGPGEFIYIPEGVVHTAVNLSTTDDLVAVEMRTDPEFNDDVVLTPQYEPDVAMVVDRLHRSETTTLDSSAPAWWNGQVRVR